MASPHLIIRNRGKRKRLSRGTHHELHAQGSPYARLYITQFREPLQPI